MPIIFESQTPGKVILKCNCGNEIKTTYYWKIDDDVVCNECYENNYSHLIKCQMNNCNKHDEEYNFVNGMCEPCNEIYSPLSREDQDGWEDNVRKLNEG